MTATTDVVRERTYRFGPLDKPGWLLGMGAAQCLALGAGVLGLGVLLTAGAPVAVSLAPALIAAILTLAPWRGRPLHEQVPAVASLGVQTALRRRRWLAPVPLQSGTRADSDRRLPLPPFLDGLEVLDGGPLAWSPAIAGFGVVHDRRAGDVSSTVPVSGSAFMLLERGDQERTLARWGEVLAAFCGERRPVSRVRVSEHAAPAGVRDHEQFLADHGRAASAGIRRTYEELLRSAAPAAVGHEVLVTVTVDRRRVRGRRRQTLDAAVEVLGEELRLLTTRLEAAGLAAGPPLNAPLLANMLHRRLDPMRPTHDSGGPEPLAGLAGLDVTRRFGPMATENNWSDVRVDGARHRTYWVAEWPRLDVGPAWLEPLLLHAGAVRTFSIHYEPVPPTRSQRRIDRDTTRLAADEEQRSRAGFRIGARHRRAESAVLERETELVAGYAELEFAGFLTITAADDEALERACAEYEQAAGQSGLELRALDARHDLGLVCALPVGRGLARRWTA